MKPMVGSEVKVGARTPGKVVELPINVGQNVKEGEVIAKLEQEDLAAKVRNSRRRYPKVAIHICQNAIWRHNGPVTDCDSVRHNSWTSGRHSAGKKASSLDPIEALK